MSEHTEQAALFQWAAVHKRKDLFERRLFAIPNESSGGTLGDILRGKKKKAEGRKSDTSDILFAHTTPCINQDFYAGLFIEMKDFGKYLTKGQKEFIKEMREAGYMAFGVRGWVRASQLIDLYLDDIGKLEPLNESNNLYYGGSGYE